METQELAADPTGDDEFAAVMLEWALRFGPRPTRRLLAVLQSRLLTRLQPSEREWELAPEVRPIVVSVDRTGRLIDITWARYAPAPRIPMCRPSTRAPRRRTTATRRARARSPGSRSDDDPPHLEVIDPAEFAAYVDTRLNPAEPGLFCVLSHAQRLSAESFEPRAGRGSGRGGVGMKPTLPLISQPQTATQLRQRVLAQLAILAVNNGKPPAKAVKR